MANANYRLDFNERAMDSLLSQDFIRLEFQTRGDHVATVAAVKAPKDTGLGAASIHCEMELTPDGWEARVSWSEERDYMEHQEFGTQHMQGKHFLEEAADEIR